MSSLKVKSPPKLSASQWQSAVERYRKSGVSQSAFASELGVSLSAFQYWLYKGRREQEAPRSEGVEGIESSRFSHYKLVPHGESSGEARYEVHLANGRKVVAHGVSIDVALVHRLVTAIDETEARS